MDKTVIAALSLGLSMLSFNGVSDELPSMAFLEFLAEDDIDNALIDNAFVVEQEKNQQRDDAEQIVSEQLEDKNEQ